MLLPLAGWDPGRPVNFIEEPIDSAVLIDMQNYTMNAKEWGLLVLISLAWGLSFFFIEIALRELGSFTVVFYRIGLAAVIVTAVMYAGGWRLPADILSWRRFFILGTFNNFVPFALISWGQIHIDSGLASVLNATTPMFSLVMAHYLTLDERMTKSRVAGILLGITGIAILVGPEALYGVSSNALGQIAILGAALSYASGGIYARQLNEMPVMVAMSGTLLAATLMSVPAVLMFEYPLKISMQVPTIGALLGMSVLGTAFAYMLYFHVIRAVGATNTMLVTFLVPVTAIFMGVFVLNESLSGHAVLGMFVIFTGLISVDGRLLRKFAK